MNKLINKKRLLIISVFIFILAVLAIFVTLQKRDKKTENINQHIKPPKVTNYFNDIDKSQINLDVSKNEITIPKDLPYLKQNRLSGFSRNEVIEMANRFDFTSEPIEFTDIKYGKVYIWNEEKNSLKIYSDIRRIKYSPAYNPIDTIDSVIDKQLTKDDYKKLAYDFFQTKLDIDKENLSLQNFIHLKPEKGLELFNVVRDENYSITQLNFYFSSSQYPIVSENSLDSQIYIQYTKDGNVLNMEALLHSDFKQSGEHFRLKSFEDIKNELDKLVIVNINNSNINLPDLGSDSIEKIDIKNISLIYYINDIESDIIQPVFLFEGFINLKNSSQQKPVRLILSAFSNQL